LLTLHPVYLALGHDAVTRASAYTVWLRAGIGEEGLAAVRAHLDQEVRWVTRASSKWSSAR